jgi:hypothetical protein
VGVSVDFLKHFTISASVLDLGFINWKGHSKYNFTQGSWEYTGFDNISTEGSGEVIEDQLNAKLEDLAKLFHRSRHYISVRLSRIRKNLEKYLIKEGVSL